MSSTDMNELTLMLDTSLNRCNVVLYQLAGARKELKQLADTLPDQRSKLSRRLIKYIVAYINTSRLKSTNPFSVNQSAALKGWGPFIYDVAMSNSPGLVPDRSMVSENARKVWKYYHDRRSDVTKERLNNGMALHNIEELDHVYWLRPGPDVTSLQARHDLLVKQFPNAEHWLDFAAQRFYDTMLVGSVLSHAAK